MKAKLIHMRSTGSRQQYFVPKDRYQTRMLQDATAILKWQSRAIVAERELLKLKKQIKEIVK
ncbi:MAG: hypothetical protein V3U78_09880 [Thiotrichaceae bacterium]